MKKIIIALIFLSVLDAAAQQPYLLIGTYTAGKSEGIYVYNFNTATAENSLISVTKTSNPSYLAVSPNKKMVYAVNENADSTMHTVGGHISAFSFADGKLTEVNKQPSGGKHPCYVAVDKTGQWVFAGNYSSGTVGLLKIKTDGSLDTLQQTIQHSGIGPNTSRQQAPHVHTTYVSPNNKYLYVADLGIDKIMVYAFNKNKGTLKLKSSAASLPGSGPRHVTIGADNKFLYLIEEMTGTAVCYKIKKDKLQFKQRISTLPNNFTGTIGSADIHVSPDGKFLYCSNRGNSNDLAIFAIHPTDGKLSLVGHQPVLGNTPRNFNFSPDGNFLLVANQNSDVVVIFKRDVQTGLLADTGKRILVPNPVCLKWVE